ncbi:MAG: hypothetical protein VKK62_07195 [Synechococcaceae cyanobacterium]|nr:hypothetical protein [Synechococcaceae cyanobacterium]
MAALPAAPALAAPPPLDPLLFPPPETFRTLQLAVLACSRENTAASCEQARRLADPLLDHPRLPTSCKDVLWSIRQKSTTGAPDDYSRRDRIDQLARDATIVCRLQAKAKPEAPEPGPPGGGPGGARPR